MTTAQLLDIIGHGDWYALIPRLCDAETQEWLFTRLMLHRDALELPDVWECATTLAGKLAGTGSWWAARRLLGTALSDWLTFDGWCLQRGFSPLDQPLWRTSAAMYTMLREQRVVHGKPDATRAAWDKLHRELYDAPRTAPRAIARWTPADEADAFRRSMAAITASGG